MVNYLALEEFTPFLKRTFGSKKPAIKLLHGGLLNQNLLVSSGDKKFVLKIYRSELSEKQIHEIHRLMRFVGKRDIPVTLPLAQTVIGGFVVVLYPFVTGTHPQRYRNSAQKLDGIGEMLGRIHVCLDAFMPQSTKPKNETLVKIWQQKKSLTEIRELRTTIKTQSASIRREMSGILDAHERALVEEDWDNRPFLGLPIRYCHGDYHTKNLLIKGSNITAVLDWEKADWSFRGMEVMRSVIFNCRRTSSELNWKAVEAYLGGYRKHASLNQLERDLAFEAGSRNVVFGFWAIKQYLGGRKALRQNVLRRVAMMKDLVKHRKEYAERISDLLA